MSILNLPKRARSEPIEPHQPIPYAPRPKPAPPGPHQLGSATLANVDSLTSMSAEEIEKLADGVDDAARETSDMLRAVAYNIRRNGMLANEQLANFVRVASTCAEAGRTMQAALVVRNEPQPEPAPAEIKAATTEGEAAVAKPVNLDQIEQAVAEVMSQSGAADAP